MSYQGQPAGYGLNGNKIFTNVAKPILANVQFTVNAADSGGLGVTSVKSNGHIANVFMHTSQTPGANNGFTNPNPAAGFVLVQMKNNFNIFLKADCGVISPNSGSAVKIDNSALTVGQVYTITTLGNATAAKWSAIGVPDGVTPAVGVSFVAKTNGGAGNTLTSRVQAPSVSGALDLEVVGNPNVMTNTNVPSYAGQWIMMQFLAPTLSTGAYVSPMIPTAPTDGSIVNMQLWFDGSSVTVDGL